jgi:hypothetical protein
MKTRLILSMRSLFSTQSSTLTPRDWRISLSERTLRLSRSAGMGGAQLWQYQSLCAKWESRRHTFSGSLAGG